MFYRTNPMQELSRFKKEVSLSLSRGHIGIDDALIKMCVYYSQHNIDEPPFLILKMGEALINGPMEAKLMLLKRWGIVEKESNNVN